MSRPSNRTIAFRNGATRAALLGGAALLLASCFRGVAVESDPGPTYSVEVVNPMPHPMIVSYDDGSGERLLGTVPANDQEFFTLAEPARRTVTIIAVDRDRTHTLRRTVGLSANQRARVVLSP